VHWPAHRAAQLRAPSEEKIIAGAISEDNSSNLKIFLPERPLLT
jgi:hypothetical protein